MISSARYRIANSQSRGTKSVVVEYCRNAVSNFTAIRMRGSEMKDIKFASLLLELNIFSSFFDPFNNLKTCD